MLGPVVVKAPRDGNLLRIFREFALSWKAFLNGVGVPVVLVGPFLIRCRVDLPLKRMDFQEKLKFAKHVMSAIERLAGARVEHRELRHPENHIGLWRGRVVFIDFDHGRLGRRSRDLNKFRAWVDGIKKASSQAHVSGTRTWR